MADDPRQWRPVGQLYVPPPPPVDPLRALLADEDRAVEKLGQLVYNVAVDHPMWIGDDGQPLEYLPAREALIGQFIEDAARAVLAALREVAGL